MTPGARLLAGMIALAAILAVGVQFGVVQAGRPGQEDLAVRAWIMLRYFTILTNLLVAAVMAAVALGRRPPVDLLATASLGIVIVGAVYHALLAPPQPLPGWEWWTDLGYHTVVPLGAALWWLAFGGHGLRLRRLWLWLTWPMSYCVYALARGQADGIYPYFFLDLGRFGAAQVGLNVLGLLAAFALAGALLWGSARALGRARV